MFKFFFNLINSLIGKIYQFVMALQPEENAQAEAEAEAQAQAQAEAEAEENSLIEILNGNNNKVSDFKMKLKHLRLLKCSNSSIVLTDGLTPDKYTFYICESPTYLYCWKIKEDDINKITTGFDLPGFYKSTKYSGNEKYNVYNKNNNIKVFNTTNCFVFKSDEKFNFYLPYVILSKNPEPNEYISEFNKHYEKLSEYISSSVTNHSTIEYVTAGTEIMFILDSNTYKFCTTYFNHSKKPIQEVLIDLTYINEHLLNKYKQISQFYYFEVEPPYICFDNVLKNKSKRYFNYETQYQNQYSYYISNFLTEYNNYTCFDNVLKNKSKRCFNYETQYQNQYSYYISNCLTVYNSQQSQPNSNDYFTKNPEFLWQGWVVALQKFIKGDSTSPNIGILSDEEESTTNIIPKSSEFPELLDGKNNEILFNYKEERCEPKELLKIPLIDKISQYPNGIFPSYSQPNVETPADLLPNDVNSQWAQLNPSGKGALTNNNFLQAGYHIGIDTVGQSLRNANLQIRSEPPNPQLNVGPWMQSTIEPDILRRPLEIFNIE